MERKFKIWEYDYVWSNTMSPEDFIEKNVDVYTLLYADHNDIAFSDDPSGGEYEKIYEYAQEHHREDMEECYSLFLDLF